MAMAMKRRDMTTKPIAAPPPPDQPQRQQALDPTRSVLVQAPAGSGKTTLLTERFLTLLAEVDDPGQVVAITFTNAAAQEMRNRILDELRAAVPSPIASRALHRSHERAWKLLDLPAQLRISTIDSFCRDLAAQQPVLSGLGGGLDIADEPGDLYRRAARSTLRQVGRAGSAVGAAVEQLLKWRDNNWQEIEDLLIDMLSKRHRWMHDFVLSQAPDWDALRADLERPLAHAVRQSLTELGLLLDHVPGSRDEALDLARFACAQPGGESHRPLAEAAGFPAAPFPTREELEGGHQVLLCLANLLLTGDSAFRKSVDKRLGFPADRKAEKARLIGLIARLNALPGLESALAAVRALPPVRYPEADWEIIRACFTLLRFAAAQLKVVFAEASAVDFVEVAQIAESVLKSEDGSPSDAAIALADGIRHLLVDEFQDTSRRQHQLLANLIAAWPDRAGRTCFLVGDPMQSIYFFREADAELFARIKEMGLEIPNAAPLSFDFVPLTANFRTRPLLVNRLNEVFRQVFAHSDGSGVDFSPAEPARDCPPEPAKNFEVHLKFIAQAAKNKSERLSSEDAEAQQTEQIIHLIQAHLPAVEQARASGTKYRIAILARARKSLVPLAEALHRAAIAFRAVDLEQLSARPEILDALALARALLNPQDRLAWLGVLRAPWCGLALDDLHLIAGADDPLLLARPIPELLVELQAQLSPAGAGAIGRLLDALRLRPAPAGGAVSSLASAGVSSLGTWLQQLWVGLGGPVCYDATALANLDLLWNCLDRLPAGEPDLLGPALASALDKLTALPDPESSGDCGVQLMTIHKSKGLEFEVVIVPDLQAKTAAGSQKLLSWLERGLPPEGETEDASAPGEITEFLVAPLPSKGTDSGQAKLWVDRVYRDRESQETRRILYVAATRARDQLHLFARPSYKVEPDGKLSLVPPSAGLLCPAWPALAAEIGARFEEWQLDQQPSTGPGQGGAVNEVLAGGSELESPADAARPGPFPVPPEEAKLAMPTLLRRLPSGYQPDRPSSLSPEREGALAPGHLLNPHRISGTPSETDSNGHYPRHQGGLLSRALGTAVHTLFEQLVQLRERHEWPAVRAALPEFQPRIGSQVRALGVSPGEASQIAAQALKLALRATTDPEAQWLLSPQPDAASEVGWTGLLSGALTNVRIDRVFRAGLRPQAEGSEAWWIIDYKTAHADHPDPALALRQLRPQFRSQLETYAEVLRNLEGSDVVIFAGLYYPRMALLDWWSL
jgi:ATP-dependent exoDNAse (exonuclease V) beta subunit